MCTVVVDVEQPAQHADGDLRRDVLDEVERALPLGQGQRRVEGVPDDAAQERLVPVHDLGAERRRHDLAQHGVARRVGVDQRRPVGQLVVVQLLQGRPPGWR